MNEREVVSLKRQLEDEYRKNTEAIDRVLNLLRQKKESTALSATGESASSSISTAANGDQPKRVRGIMALVVGFLVELPAIFTREDVFRKLKEVAPDKAVLVNSASMRNTLRYLIKQERIEVVEESSGTRGATYRIKEKP